MVLEISLPKMNMTLNKTIINRDSVIITTQGQNVPIEDEDKKRYQEQAYPFPEVNFGKSGYSLQLAPTLDDVNGKDAYVITVTSPSGAVSKKYYDAATGLKLKDEVSTDQGSSTYSYSDYRDVSGVKIPYKLDVTQQVGFTLNVTEAKVNSGLTDADFQMKNL